MAADPQPTLPGFRVLREIGRGGMATVYLAEQESLGRQVALKLLSPRYANDPKSAERFLREGRIAAQLAHRNIVSIIDVGTHAGQPYITMEYLPRGPVPESALPPEQVAAVLRDVASALHHAHARGVIHRDVKPDNILCRDDGSYALTDFGIARVLDDDTRDTQDGTTVGTPNYMSPEQLQGHELDGRADLYSLGVVAVQLLTGALPYQGPDGWSVGLQHINAALPRLPAALEHWQPLVAGLMAKKPAARLQSGEDVISRLDRLLRGEGPATTQAMEALPARRRLLRPLLLGGALAALGAVAWTLQGVTLHTPTDDVIAMPVTPPSRVAVLPLSTHGDDADGRLSGWAEGLADGVLDALISLPGPEVIARSSAFATTATSGDGRYRGKQLAASDVVEGSVTRQGDTVRIAVRWVAMADGTSWWSRRYDAQLDAGFAQQDQIASDLRQALEAHLAMRASKAVRGTRDPEAYRAFLRGNARLWSRQADDLNAAIEAFREAITRDQAFARGHAFLGIAMNMRDSQGIAATPQARAEALQHLQRAIELDPLLGEAYVGRANRLLVARDLDAAEADFRRGLDLAPSFAAGHGWFARFLRLERGDMAGAFRHYRQAMVLDPLTPGWAIGYARTLSADGQDGAALTAMRELLQKVPGNTLAWQYFGELQFAQGNLPDALSALDAAIQHDPAAPEPRVVRCRFLIDYDPTHHGRDCVAALQAQPVFAAAATEANADLLTALGNFEAARAARQRLAVKDERIQDGIRLLAMGRAQEATQLFQRLLPRMFADSPDAGDHATAYPWVAAAREAAGDSGGAARLLRAGLRAHRHRPWRGETGQRWSSVVAYALQGDMAQACRTLAAAESAGLVEDTALLRHAPALAAFRTTPCAAQTLPRLEAAAVARANAALAAID